AGLFLVPMMFAMPLMSMIAARLSATAVGSRLPLIVGALASTLGWILLAAAHAQEWEIYLATGVLGVGAGLSFAAMSNLIVEAVPPEQTGVAVGMNTIMRTIGGSLGTQLLATIISSNVLASGLPSERGFMIAFFVAAAIVSLGFLASLAVPRAPHRVRFPAPAEATAD